MKAGGSVPKYCGYCEEKITGETCPNPLCHEVQKLRGRVADLEERLGNLERDVQPAIAHSTVYGGLE